MGTADSETTVAACREQVDREDPAYCCQPGAGRPERPHRCCRAEVSARTDVLVLTRLIGR